MIVSLARPGGASPTPMRLLFVVPECVYPVSHGGASRITSILRGMTGLGHDVHVLSLVHHDADRESMLRLPDVNSSEVHLLPPDTTFTPGSPVPSTVRSAYRAWAARRIEEIVSERSIDIVQLEYTASAAYIGHTLGKPAVLVEHDIAYRSLWRGTFQQPCRPRSLYEAFDAARLYYWELERAKQADLVLAVSDEEANVLRDRGVHRVSSRVPNGVQVADFTPSGERRETRDVLFMGYFRHRPNVDALEFFIEGIWPRLRDRASSLSVSVVGSHLPTSLEAKARACGFRCTGYVEDLRDELWSHRVFVAPVRFGAGTRVKLLEASAARCAIVSTSLGAEGLGLTNGEHLLVADAPDAFSAAVLRLLSDDDLRRRLGSAARDLVKERFDWPNLVRELEALYTALLERQ